MLSIKALLDPMQHLEHVAWQFVKTYKLKITQGSLREDITEHPDYPSLLALSDVFDKYKVENIALRVKAEDLEKLPNPFLAHIHNRQTRLDQFVLVDLIKNNKIIFYSPDNGRYNSLSLEDFNKLFKGAVLLMNWDESIEENKFQEKKKEERRKNMVNIILALLLPVLTVFSAILTLYNYPLSKSLLPIIFLLFSLTGCILGMLLILYEVDQFNPTLKQMCHGGKKLNCSAILNSRASKIFGLSWSQLGLSYFLGILLIQITANVVDPLNLSFLTWLSCVAASYSIFSILYQWQIAKQWCPLCLLVQIVLISQCLVAIKMNYNNSFQFNSNSFQEIVNLLTTFTLAFLATHVILTTLKKAKNARNKNSQLQRLKYNPQIFEALLSKQKKIEKSIDGLGILIGEKDAKYKIVKVCNPYCGPCSKAHFVIENLLTNNKDISLQIIFIATSEKNDSRSKLVAHLLSLHQKNDSLLTSRALNDWYKGKEKDYETFANKYPVDEEDLNTQQQKINLMAKWCQETNITFTPTIFINQHQLPDIYTVNDLENLFNNH